MQSIAMVVLPIKIVIKKRSCVNSNHNFLKSDIYVHFVNGLKKNASYELYNPCFTSHNSYLTGTQITWYKRCQISYSRLSRSTKVFFKPTHNRLCSSVVVLDFIDMRFPGSNISGDHNLNVNYMFHVLCCCDWINTYWSAY